MTGNTELVQQIETDYSTSDLGANDKAMLAYADKLTRTPWDMVEADVIALRELGFDDRAIHDIAHVTGYYAYVNRIADGLGVYLEQYWAEGKEDYEE